MQIYADVTGREMKVSRSSQTCALGSAIAGAVAAGADAGGYESFAAAQAKMCGINKKSFKPISNNHRTYQHLYKLYKQLHDAFGTSSWNGNLANVMKGLLVIKDNVNS